MESLPNASRDRLKVLIVDADPTARFRLATALRRDGCEVIEATSFEEGKRLWTSGRPAVLIADVRLGQFNGLQLLLRAKADREDIKAIITSVVADNVLEAETRRFGGTFLVKPVTSAAVMSLVRPKTEAAQTPELCERRVSERRRIVIPRFAPDRRSADRRRTIR